MILSVYECSKINIERRSDEFETFAYNKIISKREKTEKLQNKKLYRSFVKRIALHYKSIERIMTYE